MSRLTAVARLETRLQLASPLAWALLAAVAFATLAINPVAMIPSGDAAIAGVRPFINAPYAVAQVFALSGVIFYPLLVSLMAGLSMVRDDEARIGDLLHSMALTPGEYVLGKFAGVAAAVGTVIVAHVLLAMTWHELAGLSGASIARGPFRISSYLVPAVWLLMPGAAFTAAIAFLVGERTRSAFAVSASGAAIFVLTLTGLIPAVSALPGLGGLFATIDVWGARWLSAQLHAADRGIAFYNGTTLALDAPLVATRLVALGTAALAVALAWRHCRRRVRGLARVRATDRTLQAGDTPGLAPSHVNAAPLVWRSAPPTTWLATGHVAWTTLRQLRRQPAVLGFFVLSALLAWEFGGSAQGVMDAPVRLTAGGLAVGLWELVTTLGCLMVMCVIVEVLARDRDLRMQELLLSLPVPTEALLIGTTLAALAVVGLGVGGVAAVCLGMLWLQDGVMASPGPLFTVYGVLLAPTLLLWSAVVTLVFAMTRQRSAAYVVLLVVMGLTVGLALSDGLTWANNWMLWGSLRWSDMGAFELDRRLLWVNRAATGLAAVVAVHLALLAFVRVERDGIGPRGRGIRSARAHGSAALAALLLAACVLWLQVQVNAGVDGAAATRQAGQYWRQNVLVWGGRLPPTVTHIDARISLEPSQRRMRVRGTFAIVNDTSGPLTHLPFTVGRSLGDVAWSIDGQPARREDRSGLHVVALPLAAAPGARVELAFAYEAVVPRGATRNGGGAAAFILPSGVYLSTLTPDFLPIPGFFDSHPSGDHTRLATAEPDAKAWLGVLPPIAGASTGFTSRLVIDAPEAYGVTAVGEPVSTTHEGGRTTVVWQSDHPVRFLTLVAGRWDTRRTGGVSVSFHPAHGENADRMLATLVDARRLYSSWWFPYPWDTLTVSEYPDMVSRAQGFPTNIPVSEGMGFLVRTGHPHAAEVVTAHEVAHQWWGHLLVPGRAPGADVLIEGLAHYATMRYLEAKRGTPARASFAAWLETGWLDVRRLDTERPLLQLPIEGDETHQVAASHKGAWVLWMLDQHLGRTAMDAGLREFLVAFRDSTDHPALPDLLAGLRRHAHDVDRYDTFVRQWLEGVSLPELQVTQAAAVASREGNGWQVTATVVNLGTGAARVDLVARASEEAEATSARPIDESRTTVEVAGGARATVTWRTSFEPRQIVVDPDAHLLQMNRARAVATVAKTR